MADFGDEIVIKDPTGKLKILRGGQFYDFDFPAAKPGKVLPSKQLAEKIFSNLKIVPEENLKIRLEEIVDAYLKDARDKFETKSTLIRGADAGGLSFTLEQADIVLKIIEEAKTKGAERPVKKEKVAPKVLPTEIAARGAAPTPPVARFSTPTPKMPAGVAEFVFSPADEAEILAHAQKLPGLMAGMKPIEVAKIINSIFKKSKITLDEAGQKKLEEILLTNLKDVRDGFETGETLRRTVESAGLILTPEQVDNLLRITKDHLKELEEKLKQAEVTKIKQAMEVEKKQNEEAWQSAEEQVRGKIDERWQELAKKKPTGEVVMPSELISPPIGLRPKALAVSPLATPSVLKKQEMTENKLPPVGLIQEVKKEEVTLGKRSGAEIFPSKIQSMMRSEGEPKPLEILKLATPPVVRRPPPPRDNRPRLDDVKYVPKLVGPIEELREMTLVDFRRLASEPEAATANIKEKLRLLEKESITKKIDGIKAWQESEVNRIYKEISREVLEKGMPAKQVISLRASANEPTLTIGEYQAVMELNRSLRY